MSAPILRLGRSVRVEPRYAGSDVDCRLLFMGDRYRQLLRAYPEAIRRLTRRRGLDAIARDLRESPEILQFYDLWQRDGAVGLVMRDQMFRSGAPIEDLDFELLVWDDTHHCRYALPLERFRALGRVLPLLGGDRTEPDVARQLREELSGLALLWAEELVSHLSTDGFLERLPRAAPNLFLRSPARPRVTLVAHTSLLLQSRETAVVLDPLLRTGLTVHERGRDVARLTLGAICCSHSHWDHCDVASLLFFDKRTPVIVPKVHRPTIFNPPMVPMLRLIGFEDIREVEPWQPLQIEDVELIPVPFHGEQDEPDAEIDHYTYVLRTEDWSVYGGVDAFCDTYGDMRTDLERVRREYRPNLAFLPVSQMTYSYADGGVNGFCRAIDTQLIRKTFQYTAGPDVAVEWVRLLDPKVVVPYATFTFDRLMPAPETRDFAVEMQKAGLADRLLLLRPLDAVEPSALTSRSAAAGQRRFLRRWMSATVALAQIDRRLGRSLLYRALKRLRRVARPPDDTPMVSWETT